MLRIMQLDLNHSMQILRLWLLYCMILVKLNDDFKDIF